MKAIIKGLIKSGKTVKAIGKELGMAEEEIFRLSDFSREDFLKIMIGDNKTYTSAKYYIKIKGI